MKETERQLLLPSESIEGDARAKVVEESLTHRGNARGQGAHERATYDKGSTREEGARGQATCVQGQCPSAYAQATCRLRWCLQGNMPAGRLPARKVASQGRPPA